MTDPSISPNSPMKTMRCRVIIVTEDSGLDDDSGVALVEREGAADAAEDYVYTTEFEAPEAYADWIGMGICFDREYSSADTYFVTQVFKNGRWTAPASWADIKVNHEPE